MDYESQLKLPAYLDGELPEGEARQVANWLAQDRDAVALLGELRQTRKALAGFEDGIRLPETHDFYWSKIRREIERQEPVAPPQVERTPWVLRLRRLLMPATGLALAAIAVLLLVPGQPAAPMETAVADSGAMVYRDYSAGATFVWLPYPAEDENAKQAPDLDLD